MNQIYSISEKRWRKINFTIIELMVVIGIIVILLSILLPALKKARNTTKRIACASNLKQLHLATMNYCEDNSNHFPENASGMDTWSWRLLPYTYNTTISEQKYHPEKYRDLYYCPMQNPPGGWPDLHGMPVSYGQNFYLAKTGIKQNRMNHYATSSTKIILQIDCDDPDEANYNLVDTITACRHSGRWNASFIDGHIETIGSDIARDGYSWYKP